MGEEEEKRWRKSGAEAITNGEPPPNSLAAGENEGMCGGRRTAAEEEAEEAEAEAEGE